MQPIPFGKHVGVTPYPDTCLFPQELHMTVCYQKALEIAVLIGL